VSDEDPTLVTVIVYGDGRDGPLMKTMASIARQTLAEVEVLPFGGAIATVTRNNAIATARGRFVLELSEGDYLEPTAIEKAAWALETTPRAGLVAFGEPQSTGKHREFGLLGRAEIAAGTIGPGSYMLRVTAWRKAGGFDVRAPSAAVDQDLLIRILGKGWQAPTIPEALTHLEGTAPAASPADDDAARGWLHSAHRRFYARAASDRLGGDGMARLRRRVPSVAFIPRWIARKLEVEGLTDRRRALRHPVETTLRLMPRPLKGRLWRRLNLPARPPLWTFEPRLLALPSEAHPRPIVPPASEPRKTQLLVIHHYVTIGGADAVILNLLTGIDRDRFDVHLITTDKEPDGDHKRLPLQKFAEQTDSIYGLRSFLEREYFLRFLVDFIASRRIDVVLVSLSIFAYNALPQLRSACPDTAFVDLLHAEAPYAPMDQIRLAGHYRQFLDRRVVTTEAVRAAQVARYGETPDRVVVIPNGIDTATTFNPDRSVRGAFRRELGIGDEVAIVLYFGRMSAEKRPMHVVDVAERLRERSDIAFVLLGDGPQTLVVEKAISARGLTNVYLRPTRDDHRTVMADADLMMFPSKREGLSMAGLESMSMAKPIVASRVPGWVDLVADGTDGILVEDGDIAGYADAITRLLRDRELYDRMSAAGREKAIRTFDVGDVVRAWQRLLSETVRRDPAK
jgi:glycosyltransferase involved in cell wall biosynthesis